MLTPKNIARNFDRGITTETLSLGKTHDAPFFYVTPPAASTEYIGLCFTSEPTCTSTVGETISNLASPDCSTRVLQKRADLSQASYENMAAGLEDPTCLVY